MTKRNDERQESLKESCLWREFPGDNIWRLQTHDQKIASNAEDDDQFRLVAAATNGSKVPLWCFQFRADLPKHARQAFKRIVGRNPKWQAQEDIYK